MGAHCRTCLPLDSDCPAIVDETYRYRWQRRIDAHIGLHLGGSSCCSAHISDSFNGLQARCCHIDVTLQGFAWGRVFKGVDDLIVAQDVNLAQRGECLAIDAGGRGIECHMHRECSQFT